MFEAHKVKPSRNSKTYMIPPKVLRNNSCNSQYSGLLIFLRHALQHNLTTFTKLNSAQIIAKWKSQTSCIFLLGITIFLSLLSWLGRSTPRTTFSLNDEYVSMHSPEGKICTQTLADHRGQARLKNLFFKHPGRFLWNVHMLGR